MCDVCLMSSACGTCEPNLKIGANKMSEKMREIQAPRQVEGADF